MGRTMSDNPLKDTPERDLRIRERAYHLWEAEGSPHGRDVDYWERARELVGMEEAAGSGLLPNPMNTNDPIPGVIVEEASIQQNLGEVPGRLTDQGDWRQTPMTKEELRDYEAGNTQPTHGDTP